MDDELPGDEGAFVAFVLAGRQLGPARPHAEGAPPHQRVDRLRQGREVLSEEIDPAAGELLGNYPLALVHRPLINSLVRLSSSWSATGNADAVQSIGKATRAPCPRNTCVKLATPAQKASHEAGHLCSA